MSVLFMIAGPAGSGKTTTGKALATSVGAVVMDLDDVTQELVSGFLAEHPDIDEHDALAHLRDARYAELASRVREQLGQDEAAVVVAVAPFTAEISTESGLSMWAGRVGVPVADLRVVWLTLPADVRRQRMLARAASRDAAVLSAEEALAASPTPVVAHVSIDATRPVVEQVQQLIATFR